jgi:hypothetical protein
MTTNDTSIPDGYKRCTKCGAVKPRAEFSRDKQKRDGLCSSCKVCCSEQHHRYYEVNAEKVRERQHLSYREHADERRAYVRRWQKENQDRIREQKRLYYIENRDQKLEQHRRYHEEHREEGRKRQRRYHEEHADERRAYGRRYYEEHKEQSLERYRRREARKRNLPFAFNSADETRGLNYFHGCCAICGRPLRDLFGDIEPHFDHWIALSDKRPDNPGTVATNMVPLCSPCNLSKFNRDPQEWLYENYSKRQATEIIERIERYFEFVRRGQLDRDT